LSQFSKIVRSVKAFSKELTRPITPELELTTTDWKRPRIGLAFGGGFARGLAHIGVLKVFEEEELPIDFIAGTSVGSVIGACYCSGISAKELEEIAAIIRFKDIGRYTLSRFGFVSNDRMAGMLNKILKVKTFEELRLPLAIAATDFVTGEPVTFREGGLVDAVRASCAYPGMFLPVKVNGRLLVDGLLSHVVPAPPLKEMGADKVLAVSLSAHWCNANSGPRHVFDVIGQCFSIAADKMSGAWKHDSDIIIEPDIACFGYDDFARASDLVKVGEKATREVLPQIKQWMEAPAPVSAPSMSVRPAVRPAASTSGPLPNPLTAK
jgi:NTE family protein